MVSELISLTFYWIIQAAVISLGLLGAGTNNARIAGMLRNLSSYYYKDASLLFCVRHLMSPVFLFIHFPLEFSSVHLYSLATVAGANCSRSCTFGKGFINSKSISFWSLLAITVSNFVVGKYSNTRHEMGLSHLYWLPCFTLNFYILSLCLQDGSWWNHNLDACMSWYESHHFGEISLCSLLYYFGYAGWCLITVFFIFSPHSSITFYKKGPLSPIL